MNLDELERLHRKAVGGDWRNLPSNMLNEIWEAFPALLALARDGERYRGTSGTGDYRVPHSEWKHFGNSAHFICGHWCLFHLTTQVGPWLVSTIGECFDSRYNAGGEIAEAEYLSNTPLGEEIGDGRIFETMVFPAGEPCNTKECACGMPAIGGDEVDFSGYMTRKEATEGHRAMCEKYAAIDAARKGESNGNS